MTARAGIFDPDLAPVGIFDPALDQAGIFAEDFDPGATAVATPFPDAWLLSINQDTRLRM